MPRATRMGVVLLLLAGFAAETGCGRKGPPLPPELRVADTTRDLQVVQDEGTARLKWSYPQMTTAGGPLPDLESVEVWRAEVPLAQEPPAGTTARDRQARWSLLEGRGEIIARLEGEGLDLATRGSNLELEDELDRWLSPAEEEESGEIVVWYAVRSVCCRGRTSEYSNIVRLIPKAAPPAPDGFEVTAERDGPHLQWIPVEGRRVQVERSDDGQRWTVVNPSPLTDSAWVDVGVAQEHVWFYRLRSVTAAADGTVLRMGAPGPPVQLDFPDLYPPDAPVDLVCLPEGGRVRLRWRAADGATGYSIERRAGQEEAEVLAEAVREVFFLDETPPTGNVTYTVHAVDDAGNHSTESHCRTIVEAP
ncbi:MAG: hypothetical protein KAJ78_03335 [Acidobacteria bacterium]|nr:hypothetical protein [Acidobacteriota bacterium]